MAGVPRPDLALFNGWEGGSADDSFLNQATDMVEGNNGGSNNEKKVIPDNQIDEEVKVDIVNKNDLDKETELLSGLLEELGLRYNSAMTKSCRTTKGMVICNMTCRVDTMTSFNAKLARPDRASAMLAATKEITDQLGKKFFPEKLKSNQDLCGNKQTLVDLCKSAKGPDPLLTSWLGKGLNCATLFEVGEVEGTVGADYQVPHSEAFAVDVIDSVVKQLNKENMVNRVTVPWNQGGFLELFDDSSISVPSQDDIEEVEGETDAPVKRARSGSPEKLVKKSKQEKNIMNSSRWQEVTRTHRKILEKSFQPSKSDDKYLVSKKNAGSKITAILPALKISPKKKFGMFGKFSKKVEEDVEVKPKFQLHQPQEDNKFIGKVSKKPFEKESPVKKPSFTFLEEDKISAQKSNKASGKCKIKEEDIEPVAKRKEIISSVFKVEDDPYILEIMARKKKETEKLAARTKVQTKGRKRESMTRMAEFSRSLTGGQSLGESLQESSLDETIMSKISELKKPRKKKKSDPSQMMINSIFKKDLVTSNEKESNDELEEASDYTPSIDELLRLPDRPEDGGKTLDEVLDDLDIEIAERKKKHEEEMAKIDMDITAEKQRQEERKERMKKNAVLRDRLVVEITELVLRRMFEENTEYLRNIEAGKVESSRHRAFHKSCRTRHALFYTMITDPFTDDQLEWTLEEMGKVWMNTKREQMDNNEYMWKVLLAECFIKFYMDHFEFDKKEAEKRISETPLGKAVEDSEEDEM